MTEDALLLHRSFGLLAQGTDGEVWHGAQLQTAHVCFFFAIEENTTARQFLSSRVRRRTGFGAEPSHVPDEGCGIFVGGSDAAPIGSEGDVVNRSSGTLESGQRLAGTNVPDMEDCPNDNKIERVWQDLHANLTRNHRCPNMTCLMREVRCYLRKRNRNLTKCSRSEATDRRDAA
jgi:hypothetical protein